MMNDTNDINNINVSIYFSDDLIKNTESFFFIVTSINKFIYFVSGSETKISK